MYNTFYLLLNIVLLRYSGKIPYLNYNFVSSIIYSKLLLLRSPFKRLTCARFLAHKSPPCLFIGNYGTLTLNLKNNQSKYSINTMSSSKIVKDPSLFKLQDNPSFIKERLAIYERLYKIQQDKLDAMEKSPINIKVHFNDEIINIQGESFKSKPLDIIANLDKKFSKKVIVAQVRQTNKLIIQVLSKDINPPEVQSTSVPLASTRGPIHFFSTRRGGLF